MSYIKGSVGFVKTRGNFISKAIRWFTRSQWNHTFVIYQAEPEALVVEAGTFEVILVPITKYETSKHQVVYFEPFSFSVQAVETGIICARKDIEKHYGWLQILGFIPVIIAKRLFGKKISNPARGGVICSELVLQFLRGLEPQGRWDKMDRNTISPEDLYEELCKDTRFKIEEKKA